MRKICICTGTRAEYGLLSLLIKRVHEYENCELQLLVTGAHLSEKFGYTVNDIERDAYPISCKLPLPLDDDSPVGICRSMSTAIVLAAEALDKLRPDVLVLLGDRFESLCLAQTAMVLKIPIAHIHGGERTEGLIDEAVRHAITKMAHLHFVTTDEYWQRVRQLGENPEHIYSVGAPGLEVMKGLTLLSQKDLAKSLNFSLASKFFLVTYHPVTLLNEGAVVGIKALVDAMCVFPEIPAIITYPNFDAENSEIIEVLTAFEKAWPERIKLVKNLGQQRYLSAMSHCCAVVGNSSSGLIEAPSMRVPTVNIGARQQGRVAPASVIHCGNKKDQIVEAIHKALNATFVESLTELENPYDGGETSQLIFNELLGCDLERLIVKPFYDLDVLNNGGPLC